MKYTLSLIFTIISSSPSPYHHNSPSNSNGITIANAQAIQGYINWDQNSNGLLNDDQYSNELDNGLIDVEVELRSCVGMEIEVCSGMVYCCIACFPLVCHFIISCPTFLILHFFPYILPSFFLNTPPPNNIHIELRSCGDDDQGMYAFIVSLLVSHFFAIYYFLPYTSLFFL